MSLLPHALLRFALRLDAGLSIPLGLFSALFASAIAGATHLPGPLIFWTGLICLPYGALLFWLAAQARIQRLAVIVIVLGNLLWADLALAIGFGFFGQQPSAAGWGLLSIHAVATFVFAVLQAAGWRKSSLAPADHAAALSS